MTYEAMSDEQIAKRIATDRTELERRFAQQKKDQEDRQKAMMASAISGSNGAKKRGRRSANVDAH